MSRKLINVVVGGKSASIVETTHAELVTLRDNAQLQPGQLYRITDYVATTTDPESRSANHPFDIIVIADDVNVLNENASAICHEGDTYFAKCHLETWKLKYSIDNDKTRFNWADEENGKGVVYQMIDESNNEMQYDFKGIQFKRYKITASEKAPSLVGTWAGKGNNKVTVEQNDYRWCYLFNVMFDDDNYDASVYQYDATYTSNIKNCKHKLGGTLPNCVCNVNGESSKYNCFGWTCGADFNFILACKSDNWTIGNNCCNWTCGDGCYGWICGDECNGWQCDHFCHSWVCEKNNKYWNCDTLSFDWICSKNSSDWYCGTQSGGWYCGNGCGSWKCKNNCSYWSCGNNCSYWSCENNCSYWSCGNNCSDWSCGNYCSYWSCGNSCSYWSCGNGALNWICGDNCNNFSILENVGRSEDSLNINITPSVNYTQFVGYKTDGTLRVWNPADVE